MRFGVWHCSDCEQKFESEEEAVEHVKTKHPFK